jgi:hypothetical protein
VVSLICGTTPVVAVLLLLLFRMGWSTDFRHAKAMQMVIVRIRDPLFRFSFMGIRVRFKIEYKILGKHCICKGSRVLFGKKSGENTAEI